MHKTGRGWEPMEIKDYLEIIRKKIWLIILFTTAAALAGGIFSYYYLDKVYSTSTTLMVSKKWEEQTAPIQYNDILLNQKLVKTYSEIAKSDRILNKVVERMDVNISPGVIRAMMNISSVNDTEIIRITVSGTDRIFITDLANTVAQVFIEEIVNIMKMDNVQLIDPAKVPSYPISPRPTQNIAIAGFVGMMVAVGIIFLMHYLDNTIKTPEDIQERLGLPVLGAIPDFDQ